jgi:hypothetical protein
MIAKDTAIHGGDHIAKVFISKSNRATEKGSGTIATAPTEADIHSAGQDVHTAFYEPDVSLQSSLNPQLGPILSQLNPNHIYKLVQ